MIFHLTPMHRSVDMNLEIRQWLVTLLTIRLIWYFMTIRTTQPVSPAINRWYLMYFCHGDPGSHMLHHDCPVLGLRSEFRWYHVYLLLVFEWRGSGDNRLLWALRNKIMSLKVCMESVSIELLKYYKTLVDEIDYIVYEWLFNGPCATI